jgi:hypothetical protein
MTDIKSLADEMAPRIAVVAPELSAPKLSWSEMSILVAFRAMDERRKREALERMDRIARTHPGHIGPRLRLVAGGAT